MHTSRIRRLLTAAILILGSVGAQAGFSATAAFAAVNSVVATGTPRIGATLDIASTFNAPFASGTYVVDTEVYNAGGSRVGQWFETLHLDSGSITRKYSWNTAGLPAGTYTFQSGIFHEGWNGNVSWQSAAGSVILSTSAPSSTWTLSASTSGSGTVSIAAKFVAPSGISNPVYLDTEVFLAGGGKVAQWTEKVIPGSGQSFLRNYSWNTVGKTPGTYYVHQGVFTSDWSKVIAWRSGSAKIVVSALDPAPAPAPGVSENPLVSKNGFYANPYSQAANQAGVWRDSRPGDAAYMDRIAKGGAATWIGNWTGDVQGTVNSVVTAATAQGQTPVFVAYNIPNRDCGSYSAGGSAGADTYRSWIKSFAAGVGGHKAAVVLEPDALAQISCLSAEGQAERLELLRNAVSTFKALGNTSVYLDAGHSGWVDAATMASRLRSAGIENARGFSLNVSNFQYTSSNVAYGEKLSNLVGGAKYIVDTSRNGNGPNGEWCNPSGRALGQAPTTNTGAAHADAFIWIKQPGESDGTCNGGPTAGTFWAEYALALAKAA